MTEDKSYVGMGCCPICGEQVVLLNRRLKDTFEHGKTYNAGPCDRCSKVLDMGGHFLIEVKDGEKGDNPFRTGYLVALTNEASKKLRLEDTMVCYIEQHDLKKIMGPMYGKTKEGLNDEKNGKKDDTICGAHP